jgi:tripartite-type tricarboxylate transporter receptor subunit TctC
MRETREDHMAFAATLRSAISSTMLLLIVSSPLHAQDWPARPVKVLVGAGPGGGTDISARIVGQGLSELLGQPFVVENRAGAGGTTAAEAVAKSAKDGYTAYMMSNSHAVSPALYKTLRYDPIGDFEMVSQVATAGLVLVTRPDFPAKDLAGLIATVKASPGKYNFGSAGAGTTQHFSGELLKQLAGLDMRHVPYRSTPAVVAGLLGGDVEMLFELIQTVQGQIHSGILKAIAVTSPERNPILADVPTFMQAGMADYNVTSWYGLALPAGTPSAIVQKINKAMIEVLARDSVRKQFLDLGAVAKSSSPEELKTHIAGEIAKWKKVRDAAGIEQQ